VLVSRDGRKIAIEDSAAPIRDRHGRIAGVVMVFHDVSHTRELAQQLSWQASHDALTGLINRNEFENRLRHALASARDEGHQHALLYLDLDQFKVVNDTCGHVAGDELLRQLSDINQAQMRASDTLARLGGDEFGVLLERCPQEQACRVAENLRRNMKDYRFAWENKSFEISASIGVVGIHAESGDLAHVLSAADMACYAAKESGRNRIHVYHESDTELLQRQGEMFWVARINQALEENLFLLYRQAIVPTNGLSENMEHYEVLLRLRADDGTIIAPGDFIPAAERYNLMPAIDRWVVQNLFIQQREALRSAGRNTGCDCLVAINLSGASFSDGHFLDFVRARLETHAIPPERICFEITETAAIANLTHATHFMKELRALGCRFSLDDFGSGLSSFGYLKNLPVDFLKIDGALVRQVADNPIDLAMVEAINGIGHVMGMRTIAEFVENQAIRDKLVAIGVDYVQGYGVEMPRPLLPAPIGG
jgi:diguanylate cyclase (GGDEF)-like protein